MGGGASRRGERQTARQRPDSKGGGGRGGADGLRLQRPRLSVRRVTKLGAWHRKRAAAAGVGPDAAGAARRLRGGEARYAGGGGRRRGARLVRRPRLWSRLQDRKSVV